MISILIAVHNGESTLRKTFQSIYDQTYSDWEIIIVDDGSTDKSLALLHDEKQSHPDKIKIIENKKNIGLTKSLIKAADMAKGEFLARLDVGDFFTPKKLAKQVSFLNDHKDYGLLGCAYMNNKKRIDLPTTDKKIRKTILKRNPFGHSAIIMRTKIYQNAGGYDPNVKYGQDYDLWFRMIKLCKSANLKDVFCHRSVDKDSISYQKQKLQMRQCLKTQWKYMNKFNFLNYFYLGEPILIMLIPQKIKNFLRRLF